MTFQDATTENAFAQGPMREPPRAPQNTWSPGFRAFKRGCDIYFAVVAMPFIVVLGAVLLVVNPFLNPGPLFFRQERMGQGGVAFRVWKFRTMSCDPGVVRGLDDGVEDHRITPLGRVLRQARIDEFPNFINVLLGDMSVIGPRPDMIEHAVVFRGTVPKYGDRFRVRPGITGLAQVRLGYIENADGVPRKALNDYIYIERASVAMELMIALRTIKVMLTGFGAR